MTFNEWFKTLSKKQQYKYYVAQQFISTVSYIGRDLPYELEMKYLYSRNLMGEFNTKYKISERDKRWTQLNISQE